MTRREALRLGAVGAVGAAAAVTATRLWREGPAGGGARPSLLSPPEDALFSQALLHEARLAMDPGDWRRLQEDPDSNRYYPADLSVDGEVVRNLAVRSRGDGSRLKKKPALRLDFNRVLKGQQFHGLSALVLENLVQDETSLRERLAFSVFEAAGFPTPRDAFARVTVNDEYRGLYALVEPVDKAFLRSRFGEAGGNLFEYKYDKNADTPYDLGWRGDDPRAYVPNPFQPKTHESRPDGAGLVALIRTINQAPDASFDRALSAYLDTGSLIEYLAVENALADSDPIGSASGRYNFYLYQYEGSTRFVLIPWDKDMTLQMATWPLFDSLGGTVLTRRLIADPRLRGRYVAAVSRIVESFVNDRWLGPRMEESYRQIREANLADTHKPYSNVHFELNVGALRLTIARRGQELAAAMAAARARDAAPPLGGRP